MLRLFLLLYRGRSIIFIFPLSVKIYLFSKISCASPSIYSSISVTTLQIFSNTFSKSSFVSSSLKYLSRFFNFSVLYLNSVIESCIIISIGSKPLISLFLIIPMLTLSIFSSSSTLYISSIYFSVSLLLNIWASYLKFSKNETCDNISGKSLSSVL